MNPVGAVIVAFFAVLWVAAGVHELGRRSFAALLTISILISGAIVLAATRLQFGGHGGGFNGKIYGIFVTLEGIAIAIAVVLIKRADAKQYLIPVIALIVGAHFFGMVPALQSNEFWWVGGAMCLLPLVTMSLLPERLWAPIVGIGCAVILWLSALGTFF